MPTLIHILNNTPAWVWVLFVYLLIIGIKALQPRKVPWQQLLIMPSVFLIWSLYSLYNKYGTSLNIWGSWTPTLILGAVVGCYSMSKQNIKITSENYVQLPGSWYPLLSSMVFFAIKYGIGVSYALAPETRTYMWFWLTDVITSGLISGIAWGRFMHIRHSIKAGHQKHEN
jgi:hypothetical protein